MIRLVVFDFDGTLADTNAVKEACLQRTVAGLPDGPAVLAAAREFGGDRYKIFSEVARRVTSSNDPSVMSIQMRQMVDAYSCCCTKAVIAAAERRGARAALDTLARRGFRLWVLSATPDRYLRHVLQRRGLLGRLHGWLGSSVGKEQGLLRIMARERVSSSALLFVGDSPDDQGAAQAVGVRFAAVVAESRIAAKGRFALRDLRLLVPLIDALNGGRHIRK